MHSHSFQSSSRWHARVSCQSSTISVSFRRSALSTAALQCIKYWPSLSIKIKALICLSVRTESLSSPSISPTPPICLPSMRLQRAWLRALLESTGWVSGLKVDFKLWVSYWLWPHLIDLKSIYIWFQSPNEEEEIVSFFPNLARANFHYWPGHDVIVDSNLPEEGKIHAEKEVA